MTACAYNIRQLQKEDMPAAKALWLACFVEDAPQFVDYYFNERTKPERMLGLFVDEADDEDKSEDAAAPRAEKLVSMLSFENRSMYADGRSVLVSFVAGVCTHPDFRRRGMVRALIEKLEGLLGGQNVKALLLQPFDFDFYKKLGFEPFAVRKIARLDSTVCAPSSRVEAHCEKNNEKIAGSNGSEKLTPELINKAYGAYMKNRNGALLRSAEYCAAVSNEYSLPGGFFQAEVCGDGAAYALWSSDKPNPTLDEFAYSSENAAKRLLAALVERLGCFSLPVPAELEEIAGVKPEMGETEYFNMIKYISKDVDFIKKMQPRPFDFQRY